MPGYPWAPRAGMRLRGDGICIHDGPKFIFSISKYAVLDPRSVEDHELKEQFESSMRFFVEKGYRIQFVEGDDAAEAWAVKDSEDELLLKAIEDPDRIDQFYGIFLMTEAEDDQLAHYKELELQLERVRDTML